MEHSKSYNFKQGIFNESSNLSVLQVGCAENVL